MKDYARAIEDYNKSIELVPDLFSAYFRLGQVYDKLREYDKAVAAYEKAIELEPNDKATKENLQRLLDEKKK